MSKQMKSIQGKHVRHVMRNVMTVPPFSETKGDSKAPAPMAESKSDLIAEKKIEWTPFKIGVDKPMEHTKDNYYALREAIDANDLDQVLHYDPKLMCCAFKIKCHDFCGHVEISRAFNLLFYGPENGAMDKDEREKEQRETFPGRLKLIRSLFEKKWLTSDLISDENLMSKISGHNGWEHNDKLLELLVEFLPKERWLTLKTDDDHGGGGILHQICWGIKGVDDVLPNKMRSRWIPEFIKMGCQPLAGDKDGHTIFPIFVRTMNHEMMTLYLDEYKADVNELDETPVDEKDHYERFKDRLTPLMHVLYRHATNKENEDFVAVKKTVEIMVKHGLKWDYVVPELKSDDDRRRTGQGCTLLDFIIHYNWLPVLKDVLPKEIISSIPEYKHVPVIEYGESYFGALNDRFDIIDHLKNHHHSSDRDKQFVKLEGPRLKKLQVLLDELFTHRYERDPAVIGQLLAKSIVLFTRLGDKFMNRIEETIRYHSRKLYGFHYTYVMIAYFDSLPDE